jgi:hypothetical protein
VYAAALLRRGGGVDRRPRERMPELDRPLAERHEARLLSPVQVGDVQPES